MPQYDDNGYPEHWTPAQREFWDNEPATSESLYDHQSERRFAMSEFETGWLMTGISKEEHEIARDNFFEITGIPQSAFDWNAFREYLHSIGS